MISWFIAWNKFWFIERFIHTLLLSGLLYLYCQAYTSVRKHKENILSANEKWFLTTSAIHISLQFVYHFVYPFSMIYFASNTVFFIEIICLNDTFISHLGHLPENIKSHIEQGCKYAILFFIIYGIYAILQIHSANQCGQNLMYITLPIYLVLVSFTCAEIGYIIKKKNEDINDIISTRLSVLTGQNERDIDYRAHNLNVLKGHKVFFIHLLLVLVVGFFINSILYFQKLRLVHSKTVACSALFENKHIIFMILFSLLEAVGTNALNGFIFYYYFWVRRHEFYHMDNKVSFSEAYEGLRSIMLLETDN